MAGNHLQPLAGLETIEIKVLGAPNNISPKNINSLDKSGEVPLQTGGIASKLAGQSALLMMGNIFTLVVGFPFQVYVARQLGTKNLGAFGLMEVCVQTITALFGLGVGHVAVRFLPEYLADSKTAAIRQLLQTVYILSVTMSFIAMGLALACRPFVIQRFTTLAEYADATAWMTLMIPLGMLIGISQQVLRGFFDIRFMVVMSSFLQLTLKVVFSVLFFKFGMGLTGYILGIVGSSVLCLAGMFAGIYRQLNRLPDSALKVTGQDKRDWIAYGKIMYGNSLLGLVGAPLERFLLAGTISLDAVGVLVVIRQLQSFPQIFLQVIIAIVAPMFVAAKSLKELTHLYHLATDWMCRLALPMMLFFLMRGNAILEVYGNAFSVAGTLALAIILGAQTINLGCGPVGNLLNMKGHQAKMFHVNIVSSVLLLSGVLVLVPLFGLVGVALATATSTVVANLWALRISSQRLSVSWFSRRYYRWLPPSLACSIAYGSLAFLLHVESKWWLAGQFMIGAVMFHLVYSLAGFCDDDREVIAMVKSRILGNGAVTG